MKCKRIFVPSGMKRLKIVRIMRLFSIFMLVFTLGATASGFSQKQLVSLDLKQRDVSTLFREIWKQTGLRFVYNEKYVADLPLVNVKVDKQEVKKVLDEVFKNTAFECVFESDVIYLSRRKQEADPQEKVKEVTLKGRVTDKDGNPMPGVTVRIANMAIGVTTDVKGDYKLTMSEGVHTEIIFSFVGMKSVTYRFPREKDVTYNVVMEEDLMMMEDVVVIGYGTKAQKDITSAVGTVQGEQLMKTAGAAANTFDNMLGGVLKGVLVTQNSGQLGAAATINIRGITSPLGAGGTQGTVSSANEPLYVIDGIPFFNSKDGINPLSVISPKDIESIDVLKDAAATAIYGSRGANGVIIVRTKSGKRNEKMTVTAGYSISVGNPVKRYKPLNTAEFKEYQEELYRNAMTATNQGNDMANPLYLSFAQSSYHMEPVLDEAGNPVYEPWGEPKERIIFDEYLGLNDEAFGTVNTNWVKETQNKNAVTHQYDFAVRGGGAMMNYSFSFNASDQEGLYINDRLNRYGARLSVDADVSKRTRIGASMGYTFSRKKQGDESGKSEWLVRPDVPVYTNGELTRLSGEYDYGMSEITLATSVAKRRLVQDLSKSYQFIGSAYLEYELIKNLKLHGDINLNVFQDEMNTFYPKKAQDDMTAFGMPLDGLLNTGSSKVSNSSINFRVDYRWIHEQHELNAMLGYGWDRSFSNAESHNYQGFPDDNVLNDVNSAVSMTNKRSAENTEGLNSVYFRLGYVFGNRYLAEFNFRSDASSKFGPGNKRGYFPSLSLGWRVKQESFMENVEWVNDLKLRMSYGKTGSTNVDDFSYIQFFTRGNRDLWGNEVSLGLKSVLPNRDVKWEMTGEYNVGVDFSFLGHRLLGSVDAYYRKTKGALGPAPVPYESGFGSYTANLIDMSNHGVEIEIGGGVIRGENWSWDTQFNISFNRNRLEKLNGSNLNEFLLDYYMVGKPSGILKGFVVEKIFQTQEEVNQANQKAVAAGYDYYYGEYAGPGDYMFKDVNGDGHISDEDKELIANPEPRFFGGFFNTLSWKGLSLSVMFQFSQGATAFFESLSKLGVPMESVEREMFRNTWTPENKNARYARMVPNYYDNGTYPSDRYVFKASYLRLKNISLSYDLPMGVLRKLNVQGIQVFAGISNLWTWTNWPGLDPETVGIGMPTGMPGTGSVSNIDPYPLSKTFSFGVNVQF